MTRVARSALPDGVFHVTARGAKRAAIFRTDADYSEFRASLLRVAERFSWLLHAYCLMPNHYHLIVETTQPQLSQGMHRLNGRYAQSFNERYDNSGHVFERRFWSWAIETEEHFERALTYVSLNPVEAGLCSRVTDWPWRDGPYDPD
jgi:REP-associated tyrosine transposase